MADYYSILKKTILGLSNNTPELRAVVYGKARIAIEKQLRGLSPAPSEEAIIGQLRSLEAAIVEVEAEASVADMPTAAVTPEVPIAPSPAPAPTPPPTQPEAAPIEPLAPSAPETAPEMPEPVAAAASTPPPVPSVENSAPSVTTTEGALDAMSSAVNDPSQQGQIYSAPPPETATLASEPFDGVSEKPKGKFGKFIGLLLVLLLFAGGAYAIWLNKDALIDTTQNIAETASETIEETIEPDGTDEEAAIEKEAVRIGQDGQDETPDPVDENATANEQTDLSLEPELETQEPTPTPEPDQPATPEEPTVEPENNNTTEQTIEPVGEQSDNETANSAAPLGEVAYLYEEGSGGAGATRTNAAVTWTIERQQIEQGGTQEPVIIGKMVVPERDVSLDIAIKRNIDEALSASHLIEVRFTVPEGFAGQEIEELARFVMKASEEARGEALVAVPVKVSDGFFLIALDNLPQAVEVNSQLLQTASWIDIPISYSTGKRALLTLAKGSSGASVFAEAFADWKNR